MPRKNTPEQLHAAIIDKLNKHFGRTAEDAGQAQVFRACALIVMDMLADRLAETDQADGQPDRRQVHYLSMEFLIGRSLAKNAFNLGILDSLGQALERMGYHAADIFETEPDAGLGNGGLGRLAACYMDSMTTQNLAATGYSICYEYGIFTQKIVDGQQVELPDNWMETGDVWLIPRLEETEQVRFGGKVEESWHDGRLHITHTDFTTVLAVPMDMLISGYETKNVNTLRLWDAKSPVAIDMNAFSRGQYMKAIEQNAMAQVITKVLYPDDNHFEGKSLRLKQQYFFVSATVQSIVRKHRAHFGTLNNFHEMHVLHINDTHPALVIPELMRILLDEDGMGWEKAWEIVTHSVAYTNHTIMSEALERWPQAIIMSFLPRIWSILAQINELYLSDLRRDHPNDLARHAAMAVIWDGEVRMANLCVCACFAINGVSQLHSDILKNDVFSHEYRLRPDKFHNVTNGIDHRRWLAQINPGLHALIHELIGDAYLTQPDRLGELLRYQDDAGVLDRLREIKFRNKQALAAYITRETCIPIDTRSVFDIQVKRLHEYKRQLLNILHILKLYHALRDGTAPDMPPRTFIFAAKAAPGYFMAKRIIRLINSVALHINQDSAVNGRMRVIFLENYRVSLAELLMPASNLSEQISTAGKEASGTGNMKFMLNGALTIGTLDGANVEISQLVGDENIFIFGYTAEQASRLLADKSYNPSLFYSRNPELKRAVDQLSQGFCDGQAYPDIASSLLISGGGMPDPYLLLGDFESYCLAQETAGRLYADTRAWNRACLINIAQAGRFAADRSIRDYTRDIWKI